MNYADYRTAWDLAEQGYLPPVPLNVDIELAKRCNLECVMCPYGDDNWSSTAPQGMMPLNMALQIVRDLKALGVPALKANFRGEPLMHKGLEEVLHAAQGLTDIRINTNLTGLTMARAYALKQLCTLIIVSMDGASKATYERIRVGATWERFMGNLLMLAAVKGPADVQVQMVVQKDNEAEVSKFQQTVREMGFEPLTKPVMRRTKTGQLVAGSRRTTGRRLCGHPYQRIVIGYDGTAYGCCNNWSDEYAIGHYPEQSLQELWQCERMNELRELARDPDSGYPCNECGVGTSYTWEGQ